VDGDDVSGDRLTAAQAKAALRKIAEHGSNDPEGAHIDADEVLLRYVPTSVRHEYEQVIAACKGWWYA
jgi:hypothetical protein